MALTKKKTTIGKDGGRRAGSPRAANATRLVNLRLREDYRSLIDAAAAMDNRTRTDFVVDAAVRAAKDALMARTEFALSAKMHARFLEALDEAEPSAALKKTMRTPAPWEKR